MNELLVVTPNGYKTSKLYSVVPADGTGDLTWVRNTTATRVNSSGLIESVSANVPRLDYSGGVTCPCILVEPQRTNYVVRSQEFDNASWVKSNLNTSGVPAWVDQAVAPDGTTTADKLIPNTTNTTHPVRTQVLGSLGLSYKTSSVFLKAGEYTTAKVYMSDNATGDIRADINLSTGAVTNFLQYGGWSNGSITATSYGNGWYRVVIKGLNSSNQTAFLNIFPNIVTAFAGNNSDGIYAWGGQIEIGSTVTSYIPTVATSLTRNADVATVTTPVGITSLIETYEDNTTNVVNPIPVTYQMSEGRIAKVVGL